MPRNFTHLRRLSTCPENLFQTHAHKILKKKPRFGSRSGGADVVFVYEDLVNAAAVGEDKNQKERR